MKIWLFGGVVCAGIVGGVLYLAPHRSPGRAEPVVALSTPAFPAPATVPPSPVVDVLDLNPLLDPPPIPVEEAEAGAPRLGPTSDPAPSVQPAGPAPDAIPMAAD